MTINKGFSLNFKQPLLSFGLEKKIEPLYIEKMLEEKNDNLLEADGNLEINSPEMIQTETAVLEDLAIVETSNDQTAE
ncbi:MAG TPA: hypothetical protein VIH02_09475, partial [Flavobacterium sp.]